VDLPEGVIATFDRVMRVAMQTWNRYAKIPPTVWRLQRYHGEPEE